MAKEKNAPKENSYVALTEDNIETQLDAKNRMTTAMTREMLETINKEKDEHIQKEVRMRFLRATYQCDLALLQRKFEKKKFEISLYKLRQQGRLLRFLTGFKNEEIIKEYNKTPDDLFEKEEYNEKDNTITVVVNDKGEKKTFKLEEDVPAIIDAVDYDDMKRKLGEKLDRLMIEAEKEHNKLVDKLNLSYGDYYSNSWRW